MAFNLSEHLNMVLTADWDCFKIFAEQSRAEQSRAEQEIIPLYLSLGGKENILTDRRLIRQD